MMTDEEFDNFLDEACDEQDVKYQLLIDEFGLGSYDNFVVEYENELLQFFEKEKCIVEAKILPIASHVPEKNSLVWFWSNRNIPEALRKKCEAIKKLYEVTGYEIFQDTSVECDETMVWEIAAMACKCLEGKGVYRIPHDNLNSYVLFTDIKKTS